MFDVLHHPEDGSLGYLIFITNDWNNAINLIERFYKIDLIFKGGIGLKSILKNEYLIIYELTENSTFLELKGEILSDLKFPLFIVNGDKIIAYRVFNAKVNYNS